MSESKTPRTDANDMRHQFNQQYGYNSSLDDDPVEWADFARELETELALVTEQLDAAQKELAEKEDCIDNWMQEAMNFKKQRDELAEALDKATGVITALGEIEPDIYELSINCRVKATGEEYELSIMDVLEVSTKALSTLKGGEDD